MGLIERRKSAADQHDALRVQYATVPARQTAAFRAAMTPVVAELEAVAKAMNEDPATPGVELARSGMWHGDALFDLAQGGHVPIDAVIDAYRDLEPQVRLANDATLAAKYEGNFANVLLRGELSRTHLREVIARSGAALRTLGRVPSTAGVQTTEAQAKGQLETMEALTVKMRADADDARKLLESLPSHGLDPNVAEKIAEHLTTLASLEKADTLAAISHVVKTVMPTLIALMREAGQGAAPRPRTRATQMADLAMQLWQALTARAMTPGDNGVRDAMVEKTWSLLKSSIRLRALPDGASLDDELGHLRETAAASRRLLSWGSTSWIDPIWAGTASVPLGRSAHVAGGESPEVTRACAARGLPATVSEPGQELAENRFWSMRSSAVVVADLRDPQKCAAACYEIGMALVLGKPLVVIAGAERLPFDIDVEPLRFAGALDEAVLGDAIDRATIAPQRAPAASGLADLARAARTRFPDLRFLVDELDRQVSAPVAASAVLETLLGQHVTEGMPRPLVAHPVWPRRYAKERRLFHVMPFRPSWSNEVKERASKACAASGTTYRRHDDVADPHIIRSLWDELTVASHVLVDLTDFNLNVALELGVADTLGTPVLLVGQAGTVDRLFPMLAKNRVTPYDLGSDAMEKAIARFVGGAS